MADGPSSNSLPPFESPRGTQPGGEGFFARCEVTWGRIRRWFLRRFCPRHVAHWRALRQGEDPPFDALVIDPRDLKYIRPVCNLWFRPEDDVYAAREHYGFARWGYAELVGFVTIGLVLGVIFGGLAIAVDWLFLVPQTAVWLVLLEIVWLFRDPSRTPPADPAALVSPADGTVTHVETISELGFTGPVLRISIFLSIFNIHVNRVPRSGHIGAVRYFRGEYLDARHVECSRRNEQLWIDMTDAATGTPLRIKQIAGAIARRIVCNLRPGDEVKVGDRFGMIKFGSRTDVLIPAECVAEVKVKVGNRVKGEATSLLQIR